MNEPSMETLARRLGRGPPRPPSHCPLGRPLACVLHELQTTRLVQKRITRSVSSELGTSACVQCNST